MVMRPTSGRGASRRGVSRRAALRMGGLGAGGLAFALAGCTPSGPRPQESGSGTSAQPQEFPTGDVEVRWLGPGGRVKPFFDTWFADYQTEHPNVTTMLDAVAGGEMGQIITVGVQNGNAHDVWTMLPAGIQHGKAVRDGWLAPLNDVVPNFEEWKAAFPEFSFIDGLNVFDGKVYGCPYTSSRNFNKPFLYNKQLMNDAGYDPSETPLTWDTWRDAAKKITQAGNGDYYGWVLEGAQAPRVSQLIAYLAPISGARALPDYQGVPFDPTTGEFNCTTDEHVGAAELALAMIDDGSLLPGSLGMNEDAAAYQSMATGTVGTMVGAPWIVETWTLEFPDFEFGVAKPPSKDGDPQPIGRGPGSGQNAVLYAGSKAQAVVGDQFSYYGSVEGATAMWQYRGVGTTSVFPEVAEALELTGQQQQIVNLNEEFVRIAPEPSVRSEGAAEVLLEWQAVQPDFGSNMQGVLAGELDPREALQAVQDAANAELDRAIEAAVANGAEVSREDFVFPNWDPTKDYTAADYDAL